MGLRVGAFVLAFNALWWVSIAGLGGLARRLGGAPLAWSVTLLAPLSLAWLASRTRLVPPEAVALFTVVSLAIGAFLMP